MRTQRQKNERAREGSVVYPMGRRDLKYIVKKRRHYRMGRHSSQAENRTEMNIIGIATH